MESIKPKMQYRQLGKSGLKVSVLSYGLMGIKDQNLANQLVRKAYEGGVNYFDTAERYRDGEVEILLGNALKELKAPREDLVISTKVYWGGKGVNRIGLSRKHVIEGTLASLKRLQLDYVDILFAHREDDETPLEETCRAFDWLVKNGKTLYWGTSEWPAKKIWEAFGICEKYNLEKPIVEQCEYSMITRQKMENDYVELFEKYGLGTTVWSPLCGGILAGRYNKDVPEDSRYAVEPAAKQFYAKWLSPENIGKTREKCLKIEQIAKELAGSMAQLAIAWVIKNKDTSTALLGASKVSQVEDNFGALTLLEKISPEIEEKLEAILGTRPETGLNPKTWQPKPVRR